MNKNIKPSWILLAGLLITLIREPLLGDGLYGAFLGIFGIILFLTGSAGVCKSSRTGFILFSFGLVLSLTGMSIDALTSGPHDTAKIIGGFGGIFIIVALAIAGVHYLTRKR